MEAVLIIPAFLLFLALIAAIGRTASTQADIHAAAVEGARIASLATGSTAGTTTAHSAAQAHLTREGVTCLALDIVVDAAALDLPPGYPGTVSVTITCVVPLSDLGVPGLPGQITLRDHFTTPIDPYSLH